MRSGKGLPLSTGHFVLDLLRNTTSSFNQSFPASQFSRVGEFVAAHSSELALSWEPLARLSSLTNTEILCRCQVEIAASGELISLGFTPSPTADLGVLFEQMTMLFDEAPALSAKRDGLARSGRELYGLTRHEDGAYSFSFRGLPYRDIGAFLTRWKGIEPPLDFLQQVDLLGQFLPYGELQIGPGERVRLKAGCGMFSESYRWRNLLRQLILQERCSGEAEKTILNWDQLLAPSKNEPWPAGLVLECLGSFEGCPVVGRRTSNFALVHKEGEVSWQAELELGVSDCSGLSRIRVSGSNCPPARKRSCKEAIDAGLHYLLSSRSDSGFWFDYDQPAFGYSETWPSLYVALHIHDLCHLSRAAAEEILDLLKRRRLLVDKAGWGWNFHSPPDGDTGAWYFWLAQSLNLPSDFSIEESLAPFFQRSGGLACYAPDRSSSEWTGWTQAHTCVTAAGACLDGMLTLLLPYLREQQSDEGSWESYWWKDPDHPTRLACKALSLSEDHHDRGRLMAAAKWAAERLQDKALNAFQLACNLETSLYTSVPKPLHQEWIRRLLEFQKSDGSFPSHAGIRAPAPDVVEPSLEGANLCIVLDNNRFITTATALSSLALSRRKGLS